MSLAFELIVLVRSLLRSMVLVASRRQISCFSPGSYRSTTSIPTGIVEVCLGLDLRPNLPTRAGSPCPSPTSSRSFPPNGNVVADVKVRILFDPGETFLCELFVYCPLDGLLYQLIRNDAALNVDPLVGFLGRKVGPAVVVVVKILRVGAGDH